VALVAGALAAAAAGWASPSGDARAGASCAAAYRTDLVVKVGSHRLNVEEARTREERVRGLGGRRCIGPNQGMLWTYKHPVHISFWMDGMKFPIDIVWIGPDHRVVWIEPRLSPSTYPKTFANEQKAALYVLELGAGRAKALGIKLGTPIRF
jgi:uncharacterized membrane protein (UPF0127 family)